MTNDATRGRHPSDALPHLAPNGSDWESAALRRVAARHEELQAAHGDASRAAQDWEQRAVECLRRYFRSHR